MAKKPEWHGKVVQMLDEQPRRVFTRQQLTTLLQPTEREADFPQSLTVHRVIQHLLKTDRLKLIRIRPSTQDVNESNTSAKQQKGENGRTVTSYRSHLRYIWDDPSPYEVALSLRPGSYFSHASAVFLHGLTNQIPRTLYVNKEQTPKISRLGPLTQTSIDSAFRRAPRTSNYTYEYSDFRIVLVSGKHTNDLEVTDLQTPDGTVVRATKLERTLIDITVRPSYAGGVFEVLEAFRGARDRASIPTLVATLRKLEYVYPYHQAIGFYLQRASFPQHSLDLLRKMSMDFDFYLTHKLPQPQYDSTWRIYYPSGL